MEKRGGALINIDRESLEQRMRQYLDPKLDWEEYQARQPLTQNRARFKAQEARAKVIKEETFQSERLVRYSLRPFDTRWCYYTGVRPIWNEPRPTLWKQMFPGNAFLITRFRSTAVPEGFPLSYTRLLSDDHYMTPDAVAIPLELPNSATSKTSAKKKDKNQLYAFAHEPEPASAPPITNTSQEAKEWASTIGVPDLDKSIWFHVLAVSYSSAYLTQNADGVRQDWPRIPLPNSKELLEISANLGREVAGLLDTENPVDHITTGDLLPKLKLIGQLQRSMGSHWIRRRPGDQCRGGTCWQRRRDDARSRTV